INRVNQKRKEFSAIRLSAKQKDEINRRVEAQFIYSTLKLEGLDISREQIGKLILSPESHAGSVSEYEAAIIALLGAIRMIMSLAQTSGPAAALTPDLLLRLRDPAGGRATLRKSAGSQSPALKPAPAENLSVTIESAFRWFEAESFVELHPVDQASIVYLRLVEIQPFERLNERTALAAASLFTLRGGLPPLIIKPEMEGVYRGALEEGLRMNTKPMVEL